MEVSDGIQLLFDDLKKITVGSLFSGIGGLEKGFEDSGGFRVEWQVEKDPFCQRVLKHHWPHVRRWDDVTTFAREDAAKWKVDLICGGFPCQPVSVAGDRKGDEDSRWLWPEFLRIIRAIKPRWVVGENVRGLLSADNGRLFGGILRDLADAGYDAEWTMLRASDFGLPHRRERIFIVAHLADTRREQFKLQQRPQRIPEHQGSGGALADTDGIGRWGEGGALLKSTGANRSSTQLGELREPSGSQRLADGHHEDVGSANGRRCEQRDAGIGESAESGAGLEPVGNAASVESCGLPFREEEESCVRVSGESAMAHATNDGHERRTGLRSDRERSLPPESGIGSRGIGGTGESCGCEPVADSSNGLFPQQGRGPEGRDGAGSAGASGSMGDSASVDERQHANGERQSGEGRSDSRPAGQHMADAAQFGLQGERPRGEPITRSHEQARIPVRDRGAEGIPRVPPGPADRAAWAGIIERWPWLAPAISETEAFTYLRLLAPIVSSLLDFDPETEKEIESLDQERTSQLRALGNSVCPFASRYVAEKIIEYENRRG